MSDSEIMTILVLFHTHRFRDLKSFYLGYICQHMRGDFPHQLSYNRFVERQAQVALHLLLFLQTYNARQPLKDKYFTERFLEKLKRTTKHRLYRKSITSAEGASECLKRKLELACEAARKLLMLIVTHFLPCSIFICCG